MAQGPNLVARQPVPFAVAGRSAVLDDEQAVAVGAHPEAAVPVTDDGGYILPVRRPGQRFRDEHSVSEPAEAVGGAEPHPA